MISSRRGISLVCFYFVSGAFDHKGVAPGVIVPNFIQFSPIQPQIIEINIFGYINKKKRLIFFFWGGWAIMLTNQ